MPASDDLLAIIERVLGYQHTEADLALLRQPISTRSIQGTVQIGKYNVNIGEGQALLYNYQGRNEEAEPLYEQALQLKQQLLGDDHPDVAASLNNLAGLYESQGKYEQAEPLYIQALEIADRTLGINHPNTVTFRKNLEYLHTQMQNSEG
ncbi:tetratricopeptide repeat protein [Aetokthonos hydrillicola]|jgi:tetratricopeptide (TPR) repeat protein|uniref:tetratricopeptide repeat protein n=1 Tax=Aetokthonos hydrillicola TaxID=1550245 RepID=UPI001ABB1D9D|nr:tetratricopeptide repeat protein [Aetokthonos hydrillicola]MBO3462005.1 tetratricopeptide repeat protein [Aetokthonos hydrillicola CCALA 1050]MBW4584292.1 tetratricopeptide repeat protein [Aetokthonos hydrillicola CCALA 1050]